MQILHAGRKGTQKVDPTALPYRQNLHSGQSAGFAFCLKENFAFRTAGVQNLHFWLMQKMHFY